MKSKIKRKVKVNKMNQEQYSNWIKNVSIAYLATYDSSNNQPHVRPVDAGTVHNGYIYFSTFSNTDKVEQIRSCENVELTYFGDGAQLRMAGKVKRVSEKKEEDLFLEKNPMIKDTFSNEKRNQFVLFQVTPHAVKFMGEEDHQYSPVDWKQTDRVGM
ncbi:pyridoxamine 5'-phosphate oxidase family protein [Paenibacillus peoriae]|uniref:pyridoxamine 5'-phosphate oxidase family protein n=1 Tax=Paenibacillus peoriae TaxID=59893 RepID=UPI003F9C19DF